MENITRILGVAFMATGFVVGVSQTALAEIKWLPKFQDGVARSRVNNANSSSKTNPLSCEAKGWLSEKPANLTCQPKYLVGGIKCWSDCQCDPKYKYVAGKGVTNGCPNGQTVNNDSCGGKYSGCVDCSTNTTVKSGWGTTYKSGSNVAVMTNYGTCANYYYSCNSGYKPATTQSSSYYLQTGPWNWISCGTNEKAINQDGTSNTPKLCQKCQKKVCADYNSGYVTADDPTKACTKIDSSTVGGLNCWSCVACETSIYKYDSSNCPSPKIIGTDKCNGKASTCSCPATVSCGAGITCKTQAPSGCSGCIECNTCPNEGKYTAAQCTAIGATASSSNLEICSDKYTCCTGTVGSCPTGNSCDTSGKVCPGQYVSNGCAVNLVNFEECHYIDGINHGPLSYWTAANMGL
ncbi:MAG: hypothetical protein IJW72_04805 [Alphaproteobacteria bacterium]|nr:hypothetical protein [Alphaproteobacteria bacterium]MBQ7285552.1 hypothetical protein [Alphaproteobacteria bacterium]